MMETTSFKPQDAQTEGEHPEASVVLILDDAATGYLDQKEIRDINGYVTELLQREKERQATTGKKPSAETLIQHTPDTSVDTE